MFGQFLMEHPRLVAAVVAGVITGPTLYMMYKNMPYIPTSWSGEDLQNAINMGGDAMRLPELAYKPIGRASRGVASTVYDWSPSDLKNLIDSTTLLADSGKNAVKGPPRAAYGLYQLLTDANNPEGGLNITKGTAEFLSSPSGPYKILERAYYHNPQARMHMTQGERFADDLWHIRNNFAVDRSWDA